MLTLNSRNAGLLAVTQTGALVTEAPLGIPSDMELLPLTFHGWFGLPMLAPPLSVHPGALPPSNEPPAIGKYQLKSLHCANGVERGGQLQLACGPSLPAPAAPAARAQRRAVSANAATSCRDLARRTALIPWQRCTCTT